MVDGSTRYGRAPEFLAANPQPPPKVPAAPFAPEVIRPGDPKSPVVPTSLGQETLKPEAPAQENAETRELREALETYPDDDLKKLGDICAFRGMGKYDRRWNRQNRIAWLVEVKADPDWIDAPLPPPPPPLPPRPPLSNMSQESLVPNEPPEE